MNDFNNLLKPLKYLKIFYPNLFDYFFLYFSMNYNNILNENIIKTIDLIVFQLNYLKFFIDDKEKLYIIL
jgi:hypothetical protein